MKVIWTTSAAIAALAVMVILIWFTLQEDTQDSFAPLEGDRSDRRRVQEIDVTPRMEESEMSGDEPEHAELLAERLVPTASRNFISGRVTEKESGRTVTAFDFTLRNNRRESVILETVRNEEGRFHFPLDVGGIYDVIIQSSSHQDYRSDRRSPLEVPEEGGLSDLHFELVAGESLSGRVV